MNGRETSVPYYSDESVTLYMRKALDSNSLDHTPCDCGDDGPRCDDCGQAMCCGPEMARCDFLSHCVDCWPGCELCKRERRAS